MKNNRNTHQKSGFTLVELAIVIVIIGLIIGGVLVGQDMIKSAEVRATIGQWESTNAATNTFRDKYGYIPGDINQTRATDYGFYVRTGVAAVGNGDGNGLLDGCALGAGTVQGCETVLYWRDLNDAEMIDGWFQAATEVVAASLTADALPLYFPEAKLGRGNYWVAYSAGGRNWFTVTGATGTAATGILASANSLTPFEAFNIDRKVDDSRPLQGGVRAMEGVLINVPAAAGAATCVFTGGLAYNQTTEVLADSPLCQVRLRMM
ncbi:MAG: prepilin-type N-terminal cleavage/methylation domain-containing protein [Rickettsiales bacterium]|nr:prepilin-type N-terminal cleavage/methylation domain-containing protein [Rickettsiales bacterium]